MSEVALSMGPDALRAPVGPMPADPADHATVSPEVQALKPEAERRFTEWQTTGRGLGSSSLADAVVFCSTGLGDLHSHDTEIMLFVTGGNDDFLRVNLNIDTARYFDDVSKRLAPDAENLFVLANPLLPHSEGEIVLDSADPSVHLRSPGHPYELLRRPARHEGHGGGGTPVDGDRRPMAWQPQARPADGAAAVSRQKARVRTGRGAERRAVGGLRPTFLADGLSPYLDLPDRAVVDPRLRVLGVEASRCGCRCHAHVIRGNINAPSIMIGEKAAEMIAAEHGVKLREFVGEQPVSPY